MKNSSRMLALILSALMLLPSFTACSETDDTNETEPTSSAVTSDTEASEETAAEESGTVRRDVPDSLPADLNYDGKTFTIYYSNGRDWTQLIEGGEELSGDIVSDTVFESNLSVSDRLNIDLQYYAESAGQWDTIASLVSNLILANDSTFDVYMGEQYGLCQTVTKGYYRMV